MTESHARKACVFHPQAKKAVQECPAAVQDVFGSAILDAQYGEVPAGARPFGEGVDRRVWKIAEDYDGHTYRAAYTVALPKAVYVLHVFQKKSKRGAATPRPDRETAEHRLAWAIEHHRAHFE